MWKKYSMSVIIMEVDSLKKIAVCTDRGMWFTFVFGAFVYGALEIAWRGYTHPAMLLLGGGCLAYIYRSEKRLCHKLTFVWRNTLYAVLITLSELIAGLLLNVWLKLDIWDYSGLPLNLCGQICLFFSALWFVLSVVCCFVCRAVRFVFSE